METCLHICMIRIQQTFHNIQNAKLMYTCILTFQAFHAVRLFVDIMPPKCDRCKENS